MILYVGNYFDVILVVEILFVKVMDGVILVIVEEICKKKFVLCVILRFIK